MEQLHAVIADHLRRESRSPARGSRMLTCRVCGRRVVEGDPVAWPFDVLWAAVCCPQCYREPLARDEAAALDTWRERGDVPRCRVCGVPISDDEGGLYNLANMRTVRECRDHYVPF